MTNKNSEFQFHSSKRVIGNDDGLPGAVKASLAEFQAKAPLNLRQGQGTVVVTVAVPEDNAYFAVVLAGPFANLETLRTAIAEVSKARIDEELSRIGLT